MLYIKQIFLKFCFSYLSDEQKENKKRLFNILNRLRDYIHNNSYQLIYYHLV